MDEMRSSQGSKRNLLWNRGKSKKETYNGQPSGGFNLEAHLYLCLSPAYVLANILLQKLIQRLKSVKSPACE